MRAARICASRTPPMTMFSFLKPKPKAVTPRPRATRRDPSMPEVMIGNLGRNGGGPARVEAADASPDAFASVQPSVSDVMKKLRRQLSSTETRVGELAMAWLATLPADKRPLHTCKAYPHVVNHLAGWWDNVDGLTSYFDDLLNSRRNNRLGFPVPVKEEIDTLYAYARERKLVEG